MKRLIVLLLGGVFFAQSALAQGLEDLVGDPEAGKKIARKCQTCHGRDGMAKIPIAPNIGGEPALYIARQLAAFRDGDRYHEMMTVVTAGLSDQAISDVASWYAGHTATSQLSGSLNVENAPESCTGCHGETGIGLFDDVPHLAGETVMYIDTQLKAFRSGKRVHEIMNVVAEELSDQDIRDAAEWYGATKLTITAEAN